MATSSGSDGPGVPAILSAFVKRQRKVVNSDSGSGGGLSQTADEERIASGGEPSPVDDNHGDQTIGTRDVVGGGGAPENFEAPMVADDTATAPATSKTRTPLTKPKIAAIVILAGMAIIGWFSSHMGSTTPPPTETARPAADSGWKNAAPTITQIQNAGSAFPDAPIEITPAAQAPTSSSAAQSESTVQPPPEKAATDVSVPSAPVSAPTVVGAAHDISGASSNPVEQLRQQTRTAIDQLAATVNENQQKMDDVVQKLSGRVDNMEKENAAIHAMQKQLASASKASAARPKVAVESIVRTRHCASCLPYAFITFGKSEFTVGSGDRVHGYQVEVRDDRVILKKHGAQYSYYTDKP